jgi:hypothetical protein
LKEIIFKGVVKILRVVKPGPIIMNVFDGTGTIEAIAHDKIFRQKKKAPEVGKVYDFGNLTIKDNRKKKKTSEKDSNKDESDEETVPIKRRRIEVRFFY